MPGAVAPSPHVTTADIVVLAGYFAATMAVSFAVTSRSRSVGGLVAVIDSDPFRTLVLVAGALACAAPVVGSLPGGATQLLHVAGEHGSFSLGSLASGLGEPAVWVVLLCSLTGLRIAAIFAPSMVVGLAAGWAMSMRARRELQP